MPCSWDGYPGRRAQASDATGTAPCASWAREQRPCVPSIEGRAPAEGTAPLVPCAEDPGPLPGAALPGGSTPGAAEPFHGDLLPPACPQRRRPPGPGPCLSPPPSVPAWLCPFPVPAPQDGCSPIPPRRAPAPVPGRTGTLPALERCPGSLEGLSESWDGTATLPGHPSHQDAHHSRPNVPPRHLSYQGSHSAMVALSSLA